MRETHNIPPVFDENSKILILGSFPSVKSREGRFFYHHPQNRFWRVTSSVLGKPLPVSVEQKRDFLLESGIAVWDVVQSCEIVSSSDSTIKNVIANDITVILEKCDIRAIFANGKTAGTLYGKYVFPHVKTDAKVLPSTSPANAAWSLDMLINEWNVIKDFIF